MYFYLNDDLHLHCRFDLALGLGDLDICHQIATDSESEHKWRQVADLAQQKGDLTTAQKCLLKAHDYPGLLLQATASGKLTLYFYWLSC